MAARHPLPYAFAKANTLLLEDDGAQRVLWAADNSNASALSEVVRLFDVTSFEREAAGTLSQRIAVAYAGGESSAAAVVGEVESAVDLSRLMQELPAVEDLLNLLRLRLAQVQLPRHVADHPSRRDDASRGGDRRHGRLNGKERRGDRRADRQVLDLAQFRDVLHGDHFSLPPFNGRRVDVVTGKATRRD